MKAMNKISLKILVKETDILVCFYDTYILYFDFSFEIGGKTSKKTKTIQNIIYK